MLKEMFLLLIGSSPMFAALNPAGFGLICIGAVGLAGVLWWLCNKFTGLWNRSFYMSWFHHGVCAVAGLCTLFLCITFASVGEIGRVLDEVVSEWGAEMQGQSLASSRELVHQFETTHPFVREVLHSGQADADGDIRQAEQGSPTGRTIDRVVAGLKGELQENVHRVVLRLRSILFLFFMLAQAIAFGVTGYAAHRNIRPC